MGGLGLVESGLFQFDFRPVWLGLVGVQARAQPSHSSEPKEYMKLHLLRLTLVFSSLAWGVSVFGVFASWPAAEAVFQELGAKSISHDPMLDYWLRMAAGLFTLVGGLFLLLALHPMKHRAIIPWFGGLMLAEGVVLLVHGLRLQLPPIPFAADTLACLGAGAAILYLSHGALPPSAATEH